MKSKRTKKEVLVLVAVGMTSIEAAAMSFTGTGTAPGSYYSYGAAISGDSSTIVGHSFWDFNHTEAIQWSQSGGLVSLGDFPGGLTESRATGVSTDGSVVTGWGNVDNPSSIWGDKVGFIKSASGTMTPIANSLAGTSGYEVEPAAISGNGLVVVGVADVQGTNEEAFRWTQAGGMVALGHIGDGKRSIANAVSSDGSVIVGRSGYSTTGDKAFRWTAGTGLLTLGNFADGGMTAEAMGVSSDGSSVVGYGYSANGREAFLWTEADGVIGLGDFAGGDFFSTANDVSDDGAVVVGNGRYRYGTKAFVWEKGTGMQSLKDVLSANGVDMTGWQIRVANAISDDGTTITGYANYNGGESEAYVAVIPGPPPPGEIGITGAGGAISDGGTANFGNHAVGMSKVRTFKISNDATGGATSLDDLSIAKDGADAAAFTVGAISAGSLGNGQSTTFRVTFKPTSVTAHSAAIHITSNDEDESPFDINLSGVGLANSDAEPGSDAWETSNGFSPWVPDFYTLDSDGDGIPDIQEIFFGWSRYPSFPSRTLEAVSSEEVLDEGEDFFNVRTTSNGVFKVQYRRSTTQTALIANPVWTSSLSSNDWKYSGESDLGAVVTVSEIVVSNGVDFEIVESSAEVTGGEADALFFSLELTPNE